MVAVTRPGQGSACRAGLRPASTVIGEASPVVTHVHGGQLARPARACLRRVRALRRAGRATTRRLGVVFGEVTMPLSSKPDPPRMPAMAGSPDPRRNRLLAALPATEWQRWSTQLEPIDMPQRLRFWCVGSVLLGDRFALVGNKRRRRLDSRRRPARRLFWQGVRMTGPRAPCLAAHRPPLPFAPTLDGHAAPVHGRTVPRCLPCIQHRCVAGAVDALPTIWPSSHASALRQMRLPPSRWSAQPPSSGRA